MFIQGTHSLPGQGISLDFSYVQWYIEIEEAKKKALVPVTETTHFWNSPRTHTANSTRGSQKSSKRKENNLFGTKKTIGEMQSCEELTFANTSQSAITTIMRQLPKSTLAPFERMQCNLFLEHVARRKVSSYPKVKVVARHKFFGAQKEQTL